MKPEEIKKAIADGKDDNTAPCAYFDTDPSGRSSENFLFGDHVKKNTGKYIMIRFIDTHKDGENIDIAVVAFAGFKQTIDSFPKTQTVHRPTGTWFNRKIRNCWAHPNELACTFSGGGWVCDGRDYSGGCRSGMVSFHQSTPYMATFRCQMTGFDLCESCMRDPTFGKVTADSIRIDLLTLEDVSGDIAAMAGLKGASPTAAANRIVKMIRNSPRVLLQYFECGLVDTIARILEEHASSREDSRASKRSRSTISDGGSGPRPKSKPHLTNWRVNLELTREMINVLFTEHPGSLSAGDKVWTRRPNDSNEWGMGKVESVPDEPKEGGAPVVNKRFTINFADELAHVDRDANEVWKMIEEEDEELMMATASLYQEIVSETPCDAKMSRLLQQGADHFIYNGEGKNILMASIEKQEPSIVKLLLDNGVCPDADSCNGSPLEIARAKGNQEIIKLLTEAGAEDAVAVDIKETKTLEHWRSEVARRLLNVLFAIVKAHENSSAGPDCIIVLKDLIAKVRKEDLVDAMHVQKVAQDFADFLASSFASENLLQCTRALQVIGSVLAKKDTSLSKFLLAAGAAKFAESLSKVDKKDLSLTSTTGASTSVGEITKTAKMIADQFQEQESKLSGILTNPDLQAVSAKLEQGDNSALVLLRDVLRKMKRIDFRQEHFLSPYILDRYGIGKKLLNFFHGVKVMEGNHFVASGSIEDRWQRFHEVFVGDDRELLLSSLHTLVAMTENLQVYRHKRERGLRVLTDPLQVKLAFHQSSDVFRPEMSQEHKIEPLVTMEQLKRTILTTTPIPDKNFLEACFGLIGSEVTLDDNKDAKVTDFKILTDLNLPIHILRYTAGEATEKTILSLRKVQMKSAASGTAPFLSHRVTLAQFKIAVAPVVFSTVCSDLVKVLEHGKANPDKKYDDDLLTQKDMPAFAKSLLTLCGVDIAKKTVITPTDGLIDVIKHTIPGNADESATGEKSDKKVNPAHERIHTVEIVIDPDLPFEAVVWPTIRDDIVQEVRNLPAVARRCWPGGMPQMEQAVRSSVPTQGHGPIARALTKAEADGLAARVSAVTQTRVVIDRTAIEEIGSGMQEPTGGTEKLILGAVVNAQVVPKDADFDWAPCTLVSKILPKGSSGKGAGGPGNKKDKETYSVVTKAGILIEKLPAARVKHARARATGDSRASRSGAASGYDSHPLLGAHALGGGVGAGGAVSSRTQSLISMLSSAGLLRSSDVALSGAPPARRPQAGTAKQVPSRAPPPGSNAPSLFGAAGLFGAALAAPKAGTAAAPPPLVGNVPRLAQPKAAAAGPTQPAAISLPNPKSSSPPPKAPASNAAADLAASPMSIVSETGPDPSSSSASPEAQASANQSESQGNDMMSAQSDPAPKVAADTSSANSSPPVVDLTAQSGLNPPIVNDTSEASSMNERRMRKNETLKNNILCTTN